MGQVHVEKVAIDDPHGRDHDGRWKRQPEWSKARAAIPKFDIKAAQRKRKR